MQSFDFESGVGYWAYLLGHALQREMNEELARHGITYPQWQVLAWVAVGGPQSQVELAERMKIEPPTLAGILDRMERAGWISREPDPNDRRRKVVTPTHRVDPVWEKMVQCAQHVRATAHRGITEEDLATARTILIRMIQNLDSPTPRS
ncbi:MAG: MarR family transcriptional regulator [Bacteroidales bacterium]|nr:MarR family transcriptional regulator [Bacteroidales bacterium]